MVDNGPMINAYPDSLGERLTDIASFLDRPEVREAFQSFYILPSLYHSDLDRGFSVIDYELEEELAGREDLLKLREMGIDLTLDFVLNHLSVRSPQFMDILEKGEASVYKDFFIDWNQFWEGHGVMTEMGYIQPDPEMLKPMFFRKPGLPLLMVQMPDHRQVPYWNTFYQKVMEPQGMDEGKLPSYLGQMDLNIQSHLVWDHYRQTIHRLAGYGAKIIRLDAFAYAHKQPGERNFLNEPGTWDFLEEIRKLAEPYGITLLPEIHESYEKKCYARLAEKGYLTYDFFLPGLILDALERQQGDILERWATELAEKQIRVVNMLGCHDGIPLLDLKGLLPEENIKRLIELVISRGGYVKDLHGQQGKGMYYQVNATYFSALGEDEKKLLLARAIQLFMPGKPQVWYLDLFAGCNDYEAMARAGEGGHKEINRTNLTKEQIEEGLQREVVTKQLEMLYFRNTCPAFGFTSAFSMESSGSKVRMTWSKDGYRAELSADLADCTYEITY